MPSVTFQGIEALSCFISLCKTGKQHCLLSSKELARKLLEIANAVEVVQDAGSTLG